MSIIGIPIGFYGYLFPGNINLMVVELYSAKKYRLLVLMLMMIAIFESLYCITSLTLLNTLDTKSELYKNIEFTSYVLVFLMGLWMILEKRNNKKAAHQNTILRGAISIVFHPQQIPFWIVTGILINKVIPLNRDTHTLFLFVFCNAIGTLLVMYFYMIFGKRLLNYFSFNISHINKAMGSAYILLVLYHLIFF